MKLYFLLLLAISFNLFGQYDYFKWGGNVDYVPLGSPSIKAGIAVDQYDRTFFVNGADLNHIYWQYGKLLNSGIAAHQSSNLVLVADNLGGHLFYVRNDKKIGVIEYNFSNGFWTNNSSYAITDIVNPLMGINVPNTNQVFYVRQLDNKICNFWKNTSGSGHGVLNVNAPAVAVGSNIIVNGTRVYYISTSKQLACLNWSGSSWDIVNLPNAPGINTIAIDSKIQVYGNDNIFSIFFVNSNNKVSQYYHNTNLVVGIGHGVVLQSAPNALSRTTISCNSFNECRYIGVDGNIHTLYWDGCDTWSDYKLTNSNNISLPSFSQTTNNKMLYFANGSFQKTYCLSETSGFVYKKRNKLYLNNSLFTPIGINYLAAIYSTDGGSTFFAGPNGHYANNITSPTFYDQATCQNVFEQNLAEISALGFNSIRFNNFELIANPDDKTDPDLYIRYKDPSFWYNPEPLKKVDQNVINNLFNLYDYVLSKAAQYNLKVKFFIGLTNGQKNTNCQQKYTDYLMQFAQHYKNNSTIYSYAIFQEADLETRIHPTDNSAYRGKGDICYYVNQHYNAIRNIDPNHLVNLSLFNTESAFTFDPYILNVDFISFHTYPDMDNLSDASYENVRRQIKWISNIMKPIGKPWIIGETGFPGYSVNSNIQRTGTYAQQKAFATFMLDESFSSGASGVSWWQYKNLYWPSPSGINCCLDNNLTTSTGITPPIINWLNHENYSGVKAHDNSSKLLIGGQSTNNVFLNYQPNIGCECMYNPANYYDALPSAAHVLTGFVKDLNQNPIKDAVVLSYDMNWNRNKVTYSKSNGSFSLESNNPFLVIDIAGLGFVKTGGIYNPQNGAVYNLTPVVCGLGNARYSNPFIEDENIDKLSRKIFLVYPNPSKGVFTIYNNQNTSSYHIEIVDNIGQIKYVGKMSNDLENIIDVSYLANGIYYINFLSEGHSERQKIVICR